MGVNSEIRHKAVFLDRDGVINKAVVINGQPFPPATLEEMEILPGVQQGIQLLKEAGYKIFVVTNQPDVARGKTPVEEVQKINAYLEKNLAIDEVFCCFHDGKENCNCRKPKPGMLMEAAGKWNIDLAGSFMIGDRWRDIEAADNAGVSSILIEYNYDEKKVKAGFTCSNFTEAVNYILNIY